MSVVDCFVCSIPHLSNYPTIITMDNVTDLRASAKRIKLAADTMQKEVILLISHANRITMDDLAVLLFCKLPWVDLFRFCHENEAFYSCPRDISKFKPPEELPPGPIWVIRLPNDFGILVQGVVKDAWEDGWKAIFVLFTATDNGNGIHEGSLIEALRPPEAKHLPFWESYYTSPDDNLSPRVIPKDNIDALLVELTAIRKECKDNGYSGKLFSNILSIQ